MNQVAALTATSARAAASQGQSGVRRDAAVAAARTAELASVPESELSANDRSLADWKRCSGVFSRQRRTMRSSAGETRRLAPEERSDERSDDGVDKSGGSSFKTAVMVSAVGIAAESAHSGEHFVKDRAKREDVSARIGRLAAHLLGRHVTCRPHDDARRRVLGGESDFVGSAVRIRARLLYQLRQTEIEDLDAAVFSDENVLGFQVAVDDSLFVRGRQSVRDLDSVVDGLALRQSAAIERGAQAFAFQ